MRSQLSFACLPATSLNRVTDVRERLSRVDLAVSPSIHGAAHCLQRLVFGQRLPDQVSHRLPP
jgi:hypothetical protein